MQGSKGISQWPINWFTSPMMINKIIPYADYNQWLKRSNAQLNEATNQNSLKASKVVKTTNKKKLT